MKIVKKNIKLIIGIIIGIIISSVSVYALSVASKDVSYDNTQSGSEKETVQDAIDDLYSKAATIGSYEYVTTTTINYASTDPVNISLSAYSGCSRLTADDIYIPNAAVYYDQGTSQWSNMYGIKSRNYNSSTCTLTLTMGKLSSSARNTYIISIQEIPVFVKTK